MGSGCYIIVCGYDDRIEARTIEMHQQAVARVIPIREFAESVIGWEEGLIDELID